MLKLFKIWAFSAKKLFRKEAWRKVIEALKETFKNAFKALEVISNKAFKAYLKKAFKAFLI